MSTIPDTPVDFEQEAKALIAQVRQSAKSIQGFTFAAPGRRRQINVSASVSDAFLEAVAAACDATPEFGISARLSGDQLRHALAFQHAYAKAADEMELFAKGLRDTLAEHRSEIGTQALVAYSIAKSFARPSSRSAFVPHLTNMKRNLRKSRSKATPEGGPLPTVPVTTK
jgi:hypothetical protein